MHLGDIYFVCPEYSYEERKGELKIQACARGEGVFSHSTITPAHACTVIISHDVKTETIISVNLYRLNVVYKSLPPTELNSSKKLLIEYDGKISQRLVLSKDLCSEVWLPDPLLSTVSSKQFAQPLSIPGRHLPS